jgi:hypothetical protein
MLSKPERIKKIIKMLKVPKLEDKVICFITQWERGEDYLFPLKPQEKEYKFDEQRLFPFMTRYTLLNENLSFVAYEGEENDEIKIIRVIPDTPESRPILDKKLRSQFKIKVLCIDYKFFARNIAYDFFRHIEEPIFGMARRTKTLDKDAIPLFDLFRDVSMNTKFSFKSRINLLIETVEKGKFSDMEQDFIEYRSRNHIQNIFVPSFWHKVREKGFLCEYNKLNVGDEEKKMPTDGETREDVRFFYSFEALIYWELKNIFAKAKRCKNCNALLPLGLPSKRGWDYCTKGSPNYDKCRKERQNMRSAKSYRKKSRKNF